MAAVQTTPGLGTYLTNGSRLYSVEQIRSGRSATLVVLEDCASYERVAWPAPVLWALGLRVVERSSR